jgi:hypothetical protein
MYCIVLYCSKFVSFRWLACRVLLDTCISHGHRQDFIESGMMSLHVSESERSKIEFLSGHGMTGREGRGWMKAQGDTHTYAVIWFPHITITHIIIIG